MLTLPDPPPGLAALTRASEPERLPDLLARAVRTPLQQHAGAAIGERLIYTARQAQRHWVGPVQAMLQAFPLHSPQGSALLGLAEALLRIPDVPTQDALIYETLTQTRWDLAPDDPAPALAHAATSGLGLVQSWLKHAAPAQDRSSWRHRLLRSTVQWTMQQLGAQFVCGSTLALAHARSQTLSKQGFRFSFDMLGEAAMTQADAHRYARAYAEAIAYLREHSPAGPLHMRPGISIKLSALHPRFETQQRARVHAELYPIVLHLAQQAAAAGLSFNLDAEESERLVLHLELFERLCHEPTLRSWGGLGTVVQAYQKRATAVLDHLIHLARQRATPIMVRLVKGAYWDREIKHAQVHGLKGYPVYTRKVYTDVAYMACVQQLLAAGPCIYAQFATHNAHTIADVISLAGSDCPTERYELQCLYGMGEILYAPVVRARADGGLGRPCRIYAPVGPHSTLLAYLVRRLLENGANQAFVQQLANPSIPVADLLLDPVRQTHAIARTGQPLGAPHPHIALPVLLYGPTRANARGWDLHDAATLTRIDRALTAAAEQLRQRAPHNPSGPHPTLPVHNPARPHDLLGGWRETTPVDLGAAVQRACHAQASWAQTPRRRRAQSLYAAANRFEVQADELLALLILEAGKTRAAAVAEVREAIDYLRYYAGAVADESGPAAALGPVACISPWNFPLAIFIGQIAAALAAGNTVLAKPAEQTPLIATLAVQHLHTAGIQPDVVQCLPGRGATIGASLVAAPEVAAVVLTGSCAVARQVQATLAQRLDAHGQPIPLIAETGGINAMVVDSSALPEQVVSDILTSAFDSAGQRCSALRLVCIQDEAADTILHMLRGAMAELQVGDPSHRATDIGPVIDAKAQARILAHVAAMRAAGHPVWQADTPIPSTGHYVPPTLIELDRPEALREEVFGPVLHVLRYARPTLPALLAAFQHNGYGLTFGVHSRLQRTCTQALKQSRAGNLYINRSMIGAVVGVQPFGGEGLSGTGPKAGGPLYVLRLRTHVPPAAARQAILRTGPLHAPTPYATEPVLRAITHPHDDPAQATQACVAFQSWATHHAQPELADRLTAALADAPCTDWRALPGPTGQLDLYAVTARPGILGLAYADHDYLTQLIAALAVGARLYWPVSAQPLWHQLPAAVQTRIHMLDDWTQAPVTLSVVLHHGTPAQHQALAQTLAQRPGALVTLIARPPGHPSVPLERLVLERSLSINTAATGGNTSLVTLRDAHDRP